MRPKLSLNLFQIPLTRSAASTVRGPFPLKFCGIRVDLPTTDNFIPPNNIKINKIKSLKDVYKLDEPIVCFSNKFLIIEKEVKFFLRSKMYNNKKVLTKNNQGKKIVNKLFYKIKNKPKKFISIDQLKNDSNRAIADFISGMTDRYAINLHKSI